MTDNTNEAPAQLGDYYKDPIGHLVRSWNGHLYKIIRRIEYPGLGDDVEMTVVEADPKSQYSTENHEVPMHALERVIHHSKMCPCGDGYWR